MLTRYRVQIQGQSKQIEKQKIIESAMASVRKYLAASIGELPTAFEFHGVNYNPKTFMTHFFPILGREKRLTYISHDDQLGSLSKGVSTHGSTSSTLTLSRYQFVNLLKSHLKMGKPLFLAMEVNPAFVDRKQGFFTLDGWNYDQEHLPLSRSERFQFNAHGPFHFLLIVGYEEDALGNLSRLKLLNSWGQHSGKAGICSMYADYFWEFYRNIVIPGDFIHLAIFN